MIIDKSLISVVSFHSNQESVNSQILCVASDRYTSVNFQLVNNTKLWRL